MRDTVDVRGSNSERHNRWDVPIVRDTIDVRGSNSERHNRCK